MQAGEGEPCTHVVGARRDPVVQFHPLLLEVAPRLEIAFHDRGFVPRAHDAMQIGRHVPPVQATRARIETVHLSHFALRDVETVAIKGA